MKRQRPNAAFTMMELLTVIAIIGLIAALAAPTLRNFRKGDAMLAATRQMLGAVGRARQLAISQHTTVYMVFVPTNFWGPDPDKFVQNLTATEQMAVSNLIDKQLIGYTFLSLRSIGDQPGRNTPRYLSTWQALPDDSFIPPWKFNAWPNAFTVIRNPVNGQIFNVTVFRTNSFPFPTEEAFYTAPQFYLSLPCVAFDYLGRLISETDAAGNYHDAYIPLAHGSVMVAINRNRTPVMSAAPPGIKETPPGNSINSFNLIHIDWLTGRARLERQEVQ